MKREPEPPLSIVPLVNEIEIETMREELEQIKSAVVRARLDATVAPMLGELVRDQHRALQSMRDLVDAERFRARAWLATSLLLVLFIVAFAWALRQ